MEPEQSVCEATVPGPGDAAEAVRVVGVGEVQLVP